MRSAMEMGTGQKVCSLDRVWRRTCQCKNLCFGGEATFPMLLKTSPGKKPKQNMKPSQPTKKQQPHSTQTKMKTQHKKNPQKTEQRTEIKTEMRSLEMKNCCHSNGIKPPISIPWILVIGQHLTAAKKRSHKSQSHITSLQALCLSKSISFSLLVWVDCSWSEFSFKHNLSQKEHLSLSFTVFYFSFKYSGNFPLWVR